MRPTLLFKFTICYFIILLSSLLIMNTYGVQKIESLMIKNKLEALQQEASVISSGYMESYYRGTMSLINLSSQLKTIGTVADARIWIVNRERYIISDTRNSDVKRPRLSEEFLSQDFSFHVQIPELVEEESLCVIHPVNLNFELKGYIILRTTA